MSIRASVVRLTNEGEEMKYMLLIYHEEHVLSQGEREHCYEESTQFANHLNS